MDITMPQTGKKKQDRKKHVGSLVVLFVLVILVFYYLLKGRELSEIWNTIRLVDYRYILLGTMMIFVQIMCEGSCFYIILSSLNHKIKVPRSYAYASIDLYFSAITPFASGGQPALVYYMAKDEIPLAKSGIVVLLYSVVNKLVLLGLCVVVFLLKPGLFLRGNPLFHIVVIVGLMANLLFSVVCIWAMFSGSLLLRTGTKCINWAGRRKIIKYPEKNAGNLQVQMLDFRTGADYIKEKPSVSIQVFLICVVKRIAIFSITYCVYKSFGLSGFTYFDIIAIQTILAIALEAFPIPGAVGASEQVFLLLFQMVFSAKFLMPAMLLTRGLNFYLCLLICSIVTFITHIRIMKKDK